MTLRLSAILALLLLLTACSSDLPKPPSPPKGNTLQVDADFETLEIPNHALGEGWQRVSHDRSVVPAFPPRGAFKGAGESQKLEVTFINQALSPKGVLTLVVSKFATQQDGQSMLNIILITKPQAKFKDSTLFGYTAYDYTATNSSQTGKLLNLGNVVLTVFSDDARDEPAQERLVRYLFSKIEVPIPKKKSEKK